MGSKELPMITSSPGTPPRSMPRLNDVRFLSLLILLMCLTVVVVAVQLSGCSDHPEDVGTTSAYSAYVGRHFEIVGEVNGYAVIDYATDRTRVLYVELMPPPGVAGPEIASATPVPKGTVFNVVHVLRSRAPLDRWIILTGTLSGLSLPQVTEVRLTLSPRNRDESGGPRPDLYRAKP